MQRRRCATSSTAGALAILQQEQVVVPLSAIARIHVQAIVRPCILGATGLERGRYPICQLPLTAPLTHNALEPLRQIFIRIRAAAAAI